MTLQERADQIVNEFSKCANWEERYEKIIALGKALPPLSEELKTEANKVRGCQSQVWLIAEINSSGEMVLRGDSDALIVRGLVAVLLNVYSPAEPAQVLHFPPEFLKKLGFESNLSPSRANGLHAMLKQIKNYAIAFDFIKKNKT